ncbi:MAG: AAA family ATPase [Acidobacteriota bacterium]
MEATTETKSKKATYGLPENMERQVIAWMIFFPEAWPEIVSIVKPEYFDLKAYQDLVQILLEFYERYKKPPEIETLFQELDTFLDYALTNIRRPPDHPDANLEGDIRKIIKDHLWAIIDEGLSPDFEYVRDRAIEFARQRGMREAIIKSVDLLKKEDYDGILKEWKEAASFSPQEGGLDIVDLADVERKEIEWFWHHKIPRAKLSLIVGDPATGKSWFTMFLAACVTTGASLPHSAHQTEKGRVVILSAEDDPEDTIVPRLEDCGGDKSMAHLIQGTKQGKMFNLAEDLDRLRSYLQAKGGVRLIIIDPISAYIGTGNKVNSHKDTDVRGILSPVVKLAKDFDVTIIGVMHLNKSQDLGAIYRVSGSMAFVAQARSVWLMTQEDREGEDRTLRYFSPVKANLSPVKEGLVWRVQDGGGLEFFDPGIQPPPVQEQLGPRQPERASKLDEAMRWLHDLLEDGQPKAQAEIIDLASAEGISRSTIDRAKKKLGVKSEKMPGGSSPWAWVLPRPALEN